MVLGFEISMTEIILKGKKVILRPLSLKDALRFCKWLKDREVVKFLTMYDQAPPSLKEEQEWISQRQKDKNGVTFAIDTIDGTHIGSISLRNTKSKSKHALFGIVIGNKKYWGQGYGTEAGKLIVDYGFRKLKLHKIYLNIIAYNIRGEKSYKKIGFKREGVFREHILRDGVFHDKIWMAILRDDYLKKYGKKTG